MASVIPTVENILSQSSKPTIEIIGPNGPIPITNIEEKLVMFFMGEYNYATRMIIPASADDHALWKAAQVLMPGNKLQIVLNQTPRTIQGAAAGETVMTTDSGDNLRAKQILVTIDVPLDGQFEIDDFQHQISITANGIFSIRF